MMRNTPTRRRRGVTLIEVLTAIFIMAIGLIALLTLFPLGALTMAQAVKDDRCGTAARNAESIMRTYWRDAVDKFQADSTLLNPDPNFSPAMMDPDGAGPMPDRSGGRGPSYPVYVDGFGWLQHGNDPVNSWLAGTAGTIQRRAPFHWVTNRAATEHAAKVVNLFSSPDDITLGLNSVPGSPLERERRYSWAFLVRQLDVRQNRHLELTVVVYANRPLQVSPDNFLFGETAYQATFTNGSMTATLTWGAGKEPPAIRRGGWILDATMPAATSPPTARPRGYFYRVTNVTEGTNTMTLDLETPVRDGDAAGVTNASTAIVLEGVVEVFDRGVMSE